MGHRSKSFRWVLSALLSTLLVALSVALPVYERADLDVVQVVRNPHDSASSPPFQDPSICIQARTNASAPARAHPPQSPAILAWVLPIFFSTATHTAFPRTTRARAPPVA
jgi:hypothetical protein